MNFLGTQSDNESDVGLSFADVANRPPGLPDDAFFFSLADVYYWLIIDYFIFWVLAIYLDDVYPFEFGAKRYAALLFDHQLMPGRQEAVVLIHPRFLAEARGQGKEESPG